MRAHLVRGLIAGLALGMFALPVDAQRRARGTQERGVRQGSVNVPPRGRQPAVRRVEYDRSFYAPNGRYRISLRGLRQISRYAYRRALREHRDLHRYMNWLPARRAERLHRQWHRDKGWSHREFVRLDRQ